MGINGQHMDESHGNDDVTTYGLVGQMAVRQEGAMHRKFKITHRIKPKHSQVNLRLLI